MEAKSIEERIKELNELVRAQWPNSEWVEPRGENDVLVAPAHPPSPYAEVEIRVLPGSGFRVTACRGGHEDGPCEGETSLHATAAEALSRANHLLVAPEEPEEPELREALKRIDLRVRVAMTELDAFRADILTSKCPARTASSWLAQATASEEALGVLKVVRARLLTGLDARAVFAGVAVELRNANDYDSDLRSTSPISNGVEFAKREARRELINFFNRGLK